MKERFIIVDRPRSGLNRLARELSRSGIEVERWLSDPPERVGAGRLLGALVHHERRSEIPALVSAVGAEPPPIIIWYPARTDPRELSAWSRTPAVDFLVGPVNADELLIRLKGRGEARSGLTPWLDRATRSLFKVSRSAGSRDDDFKVLSLTARELEKLFPGVQCSIVMLPEKGEGAHVISEGDADKMLNIPLDLDRYPEVRKMLRTYRPVVIKDARRHPLMKEVRKFIKDKDLHSVLAAPIFHREEVIGLILLRSRGRPRAFDRTEISFIEVIAQHVAAALGNLRLGREVAQEMQRTREAQRVAKKKTSELSRMEAIFERASDGIMVVDQQGRIKGVNANFSRLSGHSREEVEGKNIDQIISPAPGGNLSLSRVLARPDPAAIRSDHLFHLKDGERRRVSVRIDALPRGREWLISLHDVTEERELEDALRRTKDFLENVIASSMDAIIAADMTGTIILFNRAAEQISGYQADQVIGRMNIVDFYAPGVARDIMQKLRSEGYGGKGRLEACYNSLLSASGEEIPINMSAAIIYEQGREAASVGVFQDLRERIRIEKELRAAQENLMAARQREAIAALSGAASHELNQPLTSILAYVELLRRAEQALEKEAPGHASLGSLKKAAEVIEHEAERMAEVVRKLGEVTEFKTREYVGGARIIDLDLARGDHAGEAALPWESLFKHMSEAVILVGEDTMVRMANPAAERIAEENLVGKSFVRYFEGIEYTQAMESFARLKQGEIMEFETESVLASGRRKLLHIRGAPIPGRSEFLAIYRDVTEERAAENQLRELCALQDQLMNSATLPLVTFDVDGRISFWNRAAERMTGYSYEEVKGKSPEFVIHKFDPVALQEVFRKVRREGDQSGELKLKRKDGDLIKVYHVDSVMRDEEGRATGFLSLLYDLSEREAFEKELREKTRDLTVMTEIADAIRSGAGLDQILGGALRRLSGVMPLDLCAVSLPDDGEEPSAVRSLLLIGCQPEQDRIFKSALRVYEDEDRERLRGLLFLDRPVIIADASELDPAAFSGDISAWVGRLKSFGIKSIINYPLIFGDRVLGTLHIMSREQGKYGEPDLKRLEQVSGLISMALANARMFAQIERQNLELSRRTAWMEQLIRAGQGVSMEMRPEDLLSRLVDPYLEAHPRQHLCVWTEETAEAGLTLLAAFNYPDLEDGSPTEADTLVRGFSLPPELMEKIKHETLQLDLSGQNGDYQPLLKDARSALFVPLIALDRWMGLLALESHHQDPFTDEERLEAQVLAAHMAGALRNLHFYRELDLTLRFQRGLIENANALIMILDQQGKITLLNRAFEELLGRPGEASIGMSFKRFFDRNLRLELEPDGKTADQGERFNKMLRSALLGESMTNLRVTVLGEEGRESRAVFNTSSIIDRKGRFQGFIAIGQNITRYQELEKNFLQAEKLATVGQMSAGVAHDLNNPITAIINAAAMLYQSPEISDRTRNLVEQLMDSSRRIEALAQNLMSYARPSREEMAPLELRRLTLDSLSFSHYELSRGRVVVQTRIPEGLPRVRGIRDQLQQVLINLLTNASHACAEKGGGEVVIAAEKAEDDFVNLRVSDNGAGIPQKNLDRLFDPFFTTKPEGRGTGLGLTIVKEIVERHRGKIQVESEPGKGTTFTVSLPAWTEADEPTA